MRETTKIYLNTWGAYNDGSIGYGWFTPDEARAFISEDEERDGGEWFIADIDNYLGVDFGNLEYCDIDEICDTIDELEQLDEWELDYVIALMEYLNTNDAQEAIDAMDAHIIYSDIEDYYNACDELLDFNGNDFLERYFDYDMYHRDCEYDIYQASNGVCIME